MKIAFFSNVLNHHQVALCDVLYSCMGKDFTFVEISGLNEARSKMGFTAYERPYKINAGECGKQAEELAKCADVAIMGAESYPYLRARIRHSEGLTFSYSERWLKRGFKNILSPSILRQVLLYILGGRRKRWFMLCASGYLHKDLQRLSLFKGKCYKWGYFPAYQAAKRIFRENGALNILWVGRFLDWKHPELMLKLAEMLQAAGVDFRIKMIGDGEEFTKIQKYMDESTLIKDKVELMGSLPNCAVIEEMKRADVYCFTSDRQEGWGAVLGEAMAVGCCPVASSDAGSTPFLVEDGVNGMVFMSGSAEDLYEKVKNLILNPAKISEMGAAASRTIHNHWTAKVAAENFILLSKSLIEGKASPDFRGEPCEKLNH